MKTPIKHFLFAALISAFLGAPTLATAEMIATPLPGDTRLVVFTYDKHNSYQILTKPKAVTDIQFHEDERIKALALGDSIQWEVAKTADGQHLFVKPKFEGLDTSATIVTDKRTYQILLKSTKETGKWYQRVNWEYPDIIMLQESMQAEAAEKKDVEDKRLKNQVLSPNLALEQMNFNYSIEGDAAFRPAGVFDDGKFTFVRLAPGVQELPALFLLPIDSNEPELINYVVKGDYLVIQRLVDRVLLKIGKQEVKITNSKTVRRGFFGMVSHER